MVPSTPQGGTWGDNRQDRDEGRKEKRTGPRVMKDVLGQLKSPDSDPAHSLECSLSCPTPTQPSTQKELRKGGTWVKNTSRSLEPTPALGLN